MTSARPTTAPVASSLASSPMRQPPSARFPVAQPGRTVTTRTVTELPVEVLLPNGETTVAPGFW
ncbi:hypothetical protein [Streptomyces bacillaris]|uniref:hypothetical protein n=1 Tax=Streptomyces bacillaris TaxID=68179 RepID=UPI001AD7D821